MRQYNPRSPITRPISLKAKNENQCDREDDSDKKYSAQTSAADARDALADRPPLEYSEKHLFRNVEA
jgi:hypothetical protein